MNAVRQIASQATDTKRAPVLATARPVRGEPPAYTDAQRYAWIRRHRDDFAVLRALTCSDFGPEFDRRIDAAMRASQQRIRPWGAPLLDAPHDAAGVAWWDPSAPPSRRRGDEELPRCKP